MVYIAFTEICNWYKDYVKCILLGANNIKGAQLTKYIAISTSDISDVPALIESIFKMKWCAFAHNFAIDILM